MVKDKDQTEVQEEKLPVVVVDPIDLPGTSTLPIAQQIAKKIRLENQQQVNIIVKIYPSIYYMLKI